MARTYRRPTFYREFYGYVDESGALHGGLLSIKKRIAKTRKGTYRTMKERHDLNDSVVKPIVVDTTAITT